jgi:dsDNA-binding SOS-regulon protein
MAVESRFVVIRHGAEVKTFMDKKSADEYDRMLDMADNLAEVFADSPVELSDSIAEELSIYLAQKREEVLVALLAKKPAKVDTKKAATSVENDNKASSEKSETKAKETKSKEAKASKTKATAS